MVAKVRVAVVEDDPDLLETTVEYLAMAGFAVWGVKSAEALYKQLLTDKIDVLVLDLGLPGEDGISVTRTLSKCGGMPIVVVSARERLDDRLSVLEAGADRYLTKPVDFQELSANIEAAHRRAISRETEAASDRGPAQSRERWLLGRQTWSVTDPRGVGCELTAREFQFLRLLVEAGGLAVARGTLIEEVFGRNVPNGSERLDVLTTRLRKKCAAAGMAELPIRAVRLRGYATTVFFDLD